MPYTSVIKTQSVKNMKNSLFMQVIAEILKLKY